MSGEAGGLLLLPLALGVLPTVGLILAGTAIVAGVNAANNAAARREQQNRQQNQQRGNGIRNSGVERSIGNFRGEMANNMNEQRRMNAEVADHMLKELNQNRQEMLKMVNENDPQKYQQYMGQIRTAGRELSDRLFTMQEEFVKNYHVKINESMDNVTNTINNQYAGCLRELEQYQADRQGKQAKAKEIANDYIEEAKVLLAALEEDYEGTKYAGMQLADLQRTLNDAISQYSAENYEASIAAAKNVSIETIEEIYKADCKKQEWENYFHLALSLSAEAEAYLLAQETITEDAKKQAEENTGRLLEDDIIGIKISEYTDKMKDGRSQFDYLLEKTREIKNYLESDQSHNLSLQQLKEYVELLNGKIYPSVQLAVYKGILNMSNAFSRQNISEEIIDFFEEHNFNFTGYNYENDRHDGSLHIGLENDVTGEEIIVTLAPELMENGDVQTRLEIDQLKGDETNEERKEYFRTSVQKVVTGNMPGAQIKLECKKATKNKLSQKTELRDKLQI